MLMFRRNSDLRNLLPTYNTSLSFFFFLSWGSICIGMKAETTYLHACGNLASTDSSVKYLLCLHISTPVFPLMVALATCCWRGCVLCAHMQVCVFVFWQETTLTCLFERLRPPVKMGFSSSDQSSPSVSSPSPSRRTSVCPSGSVLLTEHPGKHTHTHAETHTHAK